MQQKEKRQATQQILTPVHTQQQPTHTQQQHQSSSQHREHPGPNAQAQHHGNLFRNISTAPDQHQEVELSPVPHDRSNKQLRDDKHTLEKCMGWCAPPGSQSQDLTMPCIVRQVKIFQRMTQLGRSSNFLISVKSVTVSGNTCSFRQV